MSSDASAAGMTHADVARRLLFFRNLQAATNKIHATANIDEIMLELSPAICKLFQADRVTLYLVAPDRATIVSKVKTGLNSFHGLRLPINETSVAGFVATHLHVVNLADVYDAEAVLRLSSRLHFLTEVDKHTGYRTK